MYGMGHDWRVESRQWSELVDLLEGEPLDLFVRMVEAQAVAQDSDTSRDNFICVDTNQGSILIGPMERWSISDGDLLDDLCEYGLLKQVPTKGSSQNYRITINGRAFNRWRTTEPVNPIEQVRAEAERVIHGDGFASRCPEASHHLAKAVGLLIKEDTSHQALSEIGMHLRSAVTDTVNTYTGGVEVKLAEKPVARLQAQAQCLTEKREAEAVAALAEYVGAVVRFDQRLTHSRDEAGKRNEPISLREVKNAYYLTALACYEVDYVLREREAGTI